MSSTYSPFSLQYEIETRSIWQQLKITVRSQRMAEAKGNSSGLFFYDCKQTPGSHDAHFIFKEDRCVSGDSCCLELSIS